MQREFRQPTCVLPNDAVALMAQAVPTARLLPCISEFPAGWSFDFSDVRSGNATFWMDSDRAGSRALEVTLTETCRARGTEVPSDEPGARVFLLLDYSVPGRTRGTRYYLVPGGCVTWRFDFPAERATVFLTDALAAIGTVDRSELERMAASIGFRVYTPPTPSPDR